MLQSCRDSPSLSYLWVYRPTVYSSRICKKYNAHLIFGRSIFVSLCTDLFSFHFSHFIEGSSLVLLFHLTPFYWLSLGIACACSLSMMCLYPCLSGCDVAVPGFSQGVLWCYNTCGQRYVMSYAYLPRIRCNFVIAPLPYPCLGIIDHGLLLIIQFL